MKAFDFLLIYGACALIAAVLVIQLHLGIWSIIIIIAILLIPSVWSSLNAFLDRSAPGDSDTIVRNIFLYIFYYILIIGPLHFIVNTVGFTVHRMPQDAIHIEPVLFPGDAVIFDRDAYGLRAPGIEMHPESVHVGDIVYHASAPKRGTSSGFKVHWVLASSLDTLMARDGIVTVNSRFVDLGISHEYEGPSNFGPIVVPNNQLFLVDNQWDFFPIYLKSVKGKAIGILWSKEHRGGWHTDRFGLQLKRCEPPKKRVIFEDTVSMETDSIAAPDTARSLE